MTVIGTARRIGAPLAASAAVIAACVACSSSSNGTGNPAPGSVTSPPAVSTPTFGISASASVPLGSASVTVPAASGDFCKDFNPRSVQNMGNAADINSLVKTFDKVAADAPPAIKRQADEVAQFLHAAASGNVDPSKTSKIEKDVEQITRYYIAHCR